MAVERSQEGGDALGRALAVVPIPVSAIAHPTGRPDPTDGFALTVVLIDPDTGLPYKASGGSGGDSAVHGPDATGTPPTEAPVFVAGIDQNGNVAPIYTVGGYIQTISEQLQGQPVGTFGTVVVGMDPGASALPLLVDDEGTLLTAPAVATAAAPALVEGATASLSLGLDGSLRIGGAVTGNVAHDAADSGNPVKIGGKATAAAPTPVANGDRSDFYTDLLGSQRVLVVDAAGAALDYTTPALIAGATAADAALTASPVTIGGRAATATPTAVSTNGDVVNVMMDVFGRVMAREALRANLGVQTTTITSSIAETTIVTAAASTFNDIYRLVLSNTSASPTTVTIRDGTGGATRWVKLLAAGESWGFSGNASTATPAAAVSTNWTAQCSASVASVVVTAEFVKNT